MASIVTVAFRTEAVAGAYPRRQASGVVVASKWRGNIRYLLIASAAFKTGVAWMSVDRCQFVGGNQ